MPNVFYDRKIDFKQYEIDLNDNIFKKILESRKKGIDSNRFFLRYISPKDLAKYNFNDTKSLGNFRDICCTSMRPLKGMAGCNLRPEKLEQGIRYGGIIISDPNKKIIGQFDIIDDRMIYSPIFPFFYEERDLIKFANDVYFTTIPFEDLVLNQINHANRFFVHLGNPKTIKDFNNYGDYIMNEIGKEQMIEYLTIPEKGEKVLKKHLTR